ncbi:PAS domain S-box protein [Uliginosibacterium sediminicola]|uniref:PAS domain S-box protein n=1 Tax=Uliginosibacterium sediminicola TaxID=2024550 RepID=A0ABU9YVL1_9RHOO
MQLTRWNARPTHAISVLAALAILAILVSSAFSLWDLRARELAHTRLETVSVTRMFMEASEQSFESTDLLLQNLQERLQNSYGRQLALDSAAVHLLLNTRASGVRHLNSLFVVDHNGRVVNTSREIPHNGSVADREYFKAFLSAKDPGLFVDHPVRGRIDQRWTLHMARRFNDAQGNFKGLVVAAVNTAHFEALYSLLKLDYARPVALYLNDGTLVASNPPRDNMIGTRASEIAEHTLADAVDGVDFGYRKKANGKEEAFTIGRVRQFPFLISVINEESEALEAWRGTALPIALGATLASLFIAAVASLLITEIAREGRLARELSEAHERYYQTVDSVMDAIVAVDENQLIQLFNPAAERMFQLYAKDIIGKPLSCLIPQRLQAAHQHHVTRFTHLEGGTRSMSPQTEIIGVRADGSEFPIESTISHTLIGGKKQMTSVLRDVTERRRNERELREMNQQLRGLSASLQNVREQERSRIAHELHDELGQQLTGLKLELSWLSGRLKEGRAVTPDKIDEMRQMLDVAMGAVRRIATELRPLVLDDLGFGAAVAWQAREFAKRSGLQVKLQLDAADEVSEPGLATALYRIVQESLTNVARHAAASEVSIQLLKADDKLVLRIADNGQGMQPDARSEGFGLLGMRERASAMGAEFSIRSEALCGTTIEVTLPCCSARSEEETA